MAMPPLQYEARYHKLTVSLDGLGTTTVDVHRYQNNDARLKSHEFWGNREALTHKDQVVGQLDVDVRRALKEANAKPKPGEDKDDDVLPGVTDMDSFVREVGPKVAAEMIAKHKAAMKEARAAIRATARAIHLGTAEILKNQVRPTLMGVHSGKGSPEEIAAALYLVSKYKLYDKKFASDPAAGVWDYSDRYIGLDCNGFVGNYLSRGRPEKAWDADPPGTAYLANTDIANIISRTCAQRPVATADEIVPVNTYVMAMTDANGRVIARFGPNGSVGHIFITLPGYRAEAIYPFDGKFPYEKRAKVPTLQAAESTGGVGLTLNKCQIVSATPDGVFMVKRYSHPMMPPLPFRAFRVL
jgi:hypothetical protein